jgi:hypothetical protein
VSWGWSILPRCRTNGYLRNSTMRSRASAKTPDCGLRTRKIQVSV